jgi:hypothetical protein
MTMTTIRRILILAGSGLGFSLLLGFHLPGGTVLYVTPVKGGAPVMRMMLAPGETFTIRYNHSVEDTPIWETHSVDQQGRIFIEEERYLKFGAGMGKMPGVGRMVRRGPYEVIENMHMPTGNFILRIGAKGVDHTLLWRDQQINLSARAPHVAVRFSAKPVSRLKAIAATVFRAPESRLQDRRDEPAARMTP